MNKYKRLGKNTVLVFLGNAGSKLINLIMLPLYTRWLSPAEYGTADIVNTYAMLAMGFVGWSITDAIFVIPKGGTEEEKKSYFSSGIFFSVINFSLAFLIFYLGNIYFQNNGIRNSFSDNVWYIYWMMLSMFVQSYTQQFTRSIDKMGVYSFAGVVDTLCVTLFAFVFIPSHGVLGYILSLVVAHLVSATYTFLASKSYSYFSIHSLSKVRTRELLKYSIPLLPNGIMFWFVNGLNRPLIAHYIGMDANGILAVANKLPGVISMLFTIFSNAWTISMMEEYGKKDFGKFFNTAVRCVMLPSVLASCILAVFSKPFISIIADDAYLEAYKYMPIVILGILFANLSGLLGGIFAARKQSKYFFYSSIWGAIASIISMYALIPSFGLYGATISVCISFIVMLFARYLYAKKDIKGFQFNKILITILLYIGIVIIVPLNIQLVWKVLIYIIIILTVIIVNRDIINKVFGKLKEVI